MIKRLVILYFLFLSVYVFGAKYSETCKGDVDCDHGENGTFAKMICYDNHCECPDPTIYWGDKEGKKCLGRVGTVCFDFPCVKNALCVTTRYWENGNAAEKMCICRQGYKKTLAGFCIEDYY